MNFKDIDEKLLHRAEKQIEALNVSRSSSTDQIRIHICNYEGPHIFDVGLEKILPIVLKAKTKYLLIESSNPRHAHEWKVFENIKLPKDKVIVPGLLIPHHSVEIEVVSDRLRQFASVIPKDQIMAGTDCGFSTFAGFGKVDEKFVAKN